MKPLILAIDTTGDYGSLALVEDGHVIGERALHSPEGFGHVIFREIRALLAQCGRALDQIACFASASGPGSFTGVRIGLACAKGLAEAAGRPVVAVSNLEALAAQGSQPLRAAILDARRGEIFGAVYSAEGVLVEPEVVTKLEPWLAALPSHVELVTVNPALTPGRQATVVPRELAAAIARIAARRLAAGQASDPAAIDANYVRRSDAELFWSDSKP